MVAGYNLRHFAPWRPKIKPVTFRQHFRNLLGIRAKKSRQLKLPRGPLVLLLDGLWFQFRFALWVLYQIALKPASGKTAIFLDPVLIEGRESAANWTLALKTVPRRLLKRVRAVVVDNVRGLQQIADRRGWVLQLCQFHLLLKFHGGRGMIAHSLRGGHLRDNLQKTIREALTVPSGDLLDSKIHQLNSLALHQELPGRIRASIREFIDCLDHYRAHLSHPGLGIPSTTNAVESMGSLLRGMFQRHRSASTPRAVQAWATAFTRLRPEIICNGGFSTE